MPFQTCITGFLFTKRDFTECPSSSCALIHKKTVDRLPSSKNDKKHKKSIVKLVL